MKSVGYFITLGWIIDLSTLGYYVGLEDVVRTTSASRLCKTYPRYFNTIPAAADAGIELSSRKATIPAAAQGRREGGG